VNQGELFVREISDLTIRTDARLEADFVRVLVPDTRHDLLVHQEPLQRGPAARAGKLDEAWSGEFLAEGIETQIVQDT
jgi:hypothetical protein